MKVSNQGCIRRLSLRFLLASRTRNIVAVLAIALTAVLFTSLFTIALSINEGIQEMPSVRPEDGPMAPLRA